MSEINLDSEALLDALCELRPTAKNPVTRAVARAKARLNPEDFQRALAYLAHPPVVLVAYTVNLDEETGVLWLTEDGESVCNA